MDLTCIPVLFTVNVIPVTSRHSDSALRSPSGAVTVRPRPLSTVPIVWSRRRRLLAIYPIIAFISYRMEAHAAAGSGGSRRVSSRSIRHVIRG